MPELVKIGKTTRHPSSRADELSGVSGVPTPFIVVYEQFFNDCDLAESFVHTLLSRKGIRVSERREFFRAPASEVIKAIMQAPGASSDEVQNEDGSTLSESTETMPGTEPWRDIFEEAEKHLYGLGEYIEDPEEALRLYDQAAKLGCLMAYQRIGYIYEYGAGSIQEDKQRALEYYKEGSRKGNYQCFMEMARVFQRLKNEANEVKCLRLFLLHSQNDKNVTLEHYRPFAELCCDYIFGCMLWGRTPLDEFLPPLLQIQAELIVTAKRGLEYSSKRSARDGIIAIHQATVDWIEHLRPMVPNPANSVNLQFSSHGIRATPGKSDSHKYK